MWVGEIGQSTQRRAPGVNFPTTAGAFELENPLLAAGGGHSPQLMGVIEVAMEDPDGFTLTFATGQLIDVTDGTGTLRHCKVVTWSNVGPLRQITLADLNQGA